MSSQDGSYEEGSLALAGTVAMGTGVMIGAGIFALTGRRRLRSVVHGWYRHNRDCFRFAGQHLRRIAHACHAH